MENLKNAKVISLPTNSEGIHYWKGKTKIHIREHLYVTTYDEIKLGDWVICSDYENSYQILGKVSHIGSPFNFKNTLQINGDKDLHNDRHNLSYCRKIIATTDKSLIIGKEHDDTVPYPKRKNIYLPQPTQAFIKQYYELGGIDEVLVEYHNRFTTNQGLGYQQYGIYDIDKIINNKVYGKLNETGNPFNQDLTIPFDLDILKQEGNQFGIKVDSHNIITIHPIKDSWSREEVIEIIKKYALEQHIITPHSSMLNNWIKENLK